jgi:PucR C-terminal helix-turn-helix domain/GGDEF-like domain
MGRAGREGGAVAELAARLRERRAEIERATLTRVYAIADPPEAADPSYAEGLRGAVSAALDYGLAAIERPGPRAPRVPTALLAQARLAAREGIDIDTVLRRYFAGYTLFGDFLVREAEGHRRLGPAGLKRLLRSEAASFERLVAAVSEEHRREAAAGTRGPDRRRGELVERLLDGELLDAAELSYELEVCHLALLGAAGTGEEIRSLARSLDARLLALERPDGTVWAWLGRRRPIDPEQARRLARELLSPRAALALGEPGEGAEGWRLSHRQARAALPIALRGGERPVRYADVALLASILRDELAVASLRRICLEPLAAGRDGGAALRETLRAYFACGRNISSAAVALKVDRRTVSNRLRAAEALIGHPLDARAAELETALRLEQLG